MSSYDHDFYNAQVEGSLRSAEVVVPIVMELLQPKSVIDVGCGVGTWLSIYKANGLNQVIGLDGDYVDANSLKIDSEEFKATELTASFEVNKSFDLVQSLEVAEHLDKRHAKDFVRKLVELGKAVLFSGAVPYQLGTHHVNEQLLPYWVDLFKAHGYQLVDCIRSQIWSDDRVEVCYRQNIVIFAASDLIESNAKLEAAYNETNPDMCSIIHPELYMPRVNRLINTAFEAAQHLHRSGKLQEADTLYRSLLSFDPHASDIWDCHGQLAAHAGNYDVALVSLKKAIEYAPNVATHYYNLGQVHLFRSDKSEAKVLFEKALALQPNYPSAKQALNSLTNK